MTCYIMLWPILILWQVIATKGRNASHHGSTSCRLEAERECKVASAWAKCNDFIEQPVMLFAENVSRWVGWHHPTLKHGPKSRSRHFSKRNLALHEVIWCDMKHESSWEYLTLFIRNNIPLPVFHWLYPRMPSVLIKELSIAQTRPCRRTLRIAMRWFRSDRSQSDCSKHTGCCPSSLVSILFLG